MGITVGPAPTPPPAPQDPSLLRGAARENKDITLHGSKVLTDGQGSPDVIINDEGAWREQISKHKCDAHGEEAVLAGVQQIYINDVRAVRLHDYLVAGGILDPIVTGSPDVFMGDDGFGLTQKSEFCAKFNELMSKWPTMTPAERQTATESLVGDVAKSKGMPAPRMTYDNGSATFNPGNWTMNLPRNHLEVYGGRAAGKGGDIFQEGTLSSYEQCRFGKSMVHELRHQTMAWNALRKIAQNPDVTKGLKYWPWSSKNLPKDVLTAAGNSPIPAGSPEDTEAVNSIYDYYGDDGIADGDYRHTPGGADAARYDWKVGCCTENH